MKNIPYEPIAARLKRSELSCRLKVHHFYRKQALRQKHWREEARKAGRMDVNEQSVVATGANAGDAPAPSRGTVSRRHQPNRSSQRSGIKLDLLKKGTTSCNHGCAMDGEIAGVKDESAGPSPDVDGAAALLHAVEAPSVREPAVTSAQACSVQEPAATSSRTGLDLLCAAARMSEERKAESSAATTEPNPSVLRDGTGRVPISYIVSCANAFSHEQHEAVC